MSAVPLVITSISAFLLGSIPNGFLVAKAKGIDIREHGSKNIGATNVLRVLGKGPGYTVFALDALKGIIAVLLGRLLAFSPDQFGEIVAAISCILGHSYTPWLGFKGGKGVATTAGILLALFNPFILLTVLAVWLIFFYSTRYVSVASLAAAVVIPVAVFFMSNRGRYSGTPLLVFSVVVCLLVVLRHKTNIVRLLNGTETQFAKKK